VQKPPSDAQKVQSLDGDEKVTVTVKLQLFVWPSWDCAFACTVAVPTEKLLPDGGVTFKFTGGFPPDVVTV